LKCKFSRNRDAKQSRGEQVMGMKSLAIKKSVHPIIGSLQKRKRFTFVGKLLLIMGSPFTSVPI
jgi:hypothetical protein